MDALHAAVARFLREQGITRMQPLLAAVSGGADSMALLHILVQLGQRVAAAHVHHELRGADADADLAHVAARAAQLGVALHQRRASELGLPPAPRTSPEARARALRYAALEQMRARGGFSHVLTAHTLDDQAETLLLRALRGTHLAGLTGIAPRSDSRHLLRPLLAARRAELREYLRRRSLAWREDATNADPRVPRNLLRAEVLPLLERVHPGALPHLAALASAARDWREPLEREAEARLAAASREEDGGVWVDLEPLAAHPAAERRLVLVALLRRAGLGARVTRAHVERLERFLETAHPGQALSLPLRRTLLRSTQRVWLGPAAGPGGSFVRELAAGSVLELPRCDLRLCFEPAEAQRPRREGELRLDPPVPGRLIVRSPTPSDVLEAAGGARRLSEWLSDARWPRAIQRRLAVVEKEGRIVGVVGASASGTCTWPPVSAEQCGSDVQWSSDVQCGWQVRAERLSGVSAS